MMDTREPVPYLQHPSPSLTVLRCLVTCLVMLSACPIIVAAYDITTVKSLPPISPLSALTLQSSSAKNVTQKSGTLSPLQKQKRQRQQQQHEQIKQVEQQTPSDNLHGSIGSIETASFLEAKTTHTTLPNNNFNKNNNNNNNNNHIENIHQNNYNHNNNYNDNYNPDIITPLQQHSRPPNLVRLGVILPFTGSHPWVLPQILPAILLAVERVTNQSALLSKQTVHVTSQDSACSETFGPLAAIDLYFNQSADVFLGPACPYSVAPVARFSHFWGIPVLTAGGLVTDLKNKTVYKMLTRVQGPHAKVSEAIMTIVQTYDWSVLGLLYDDVSESGEAGKRTCYFCVEAVFHDYYTLHHEKPYTRAFDELAPDVDFTVLLTDVSKRSRGKRGTRLRFKDREINKCVMLYI